MTEKSLIESFDLNYNEVLKEISLAAQKSGRNEKDITLLAAVKTVKPDLINYAISKGIKFIGDNKANELKQKEPFITGEVTKHFIGHLQTNKVKDVVPRVSMIESVDSLRLAEAINKECQKHNKVMPVLLEVNIGGEQSKSGFSPEEILWAVKTVAKLPNIKVEGLMCIPPICENDNELKQYFLNMQKLFIDIRDKNIDNVSMSVLSMGMSDSYALAIECGATLVRIGTVLFGKRDYSK